MTTRPRELDPQWFQILATRIDELLLIVDEQFNILFANDAFSEWVMQPVKELIGKSFPESFVPALERQSTVAAMSVMADQVVPCHVVGLRGTREYLFRLYDLGDGVKGMSGQVGNPADTATDLREGQLRLASILETAVDGIVMIDFKGTVLAFNKGAENQFGYLAKEIIGENIARLMPNPYAASHDEFIANYLRTGVSKIIGKGREVMGRRRDGSLFPIHLSVGREFTLGDRICFTGVVRDLSREKRIENQLRQAQKMESIGTLAGGIAHDFNNILGGIMGYVELMLEDAEPGSYLQDDLNEMRNACQRGKDLILQILTFSRQDRTTKVPLGFTSIVKESLKLLRPVIPANIEITCTLDKDVPNVLADATQIHQIMMNLCTNAYHALERESAWIQVRLTRIVLSPSYKGVQPNLPYGPYVLLQVADNGTGMDETTLQRIFDPFFTTKTQGKGTGMGLAVVHGIVQNHSGDIVVESRVGEGTCFSLFFPAHDEAVGEETLHSLPRTIGRERIMLVDDDDLLIKVQSRILARRGYQVTTFANGLDALEYFRGHQDGFDLIITDQTMPKMTGIELAAEIVRLREDLPIIITTGFSDAIMPDKVAAKGIRELLRKPVDSEELTNAVRRVLDAETED